MDGRYHMRESIHQSLALAFKERFLIRSNTAVALMRIFLSMCQDTF